MPQPIGQIYIIPKVKDLVENNYYNKGSDKIKPNDLEKAKPKPKDDKKKLFV